VLKEMTRRGYSEAEMDNYVDRASLMTYADAAVEAGKFVTL
jgi:hypothetical protein